MMREYEQAIRASDFGNVAQAEEPADILNEMLSSVRAAVVDMERMAEEADRMARRARERLIILELEAEERNVRG